MVFVFAFGTVVALLWAGFQLVTVQEDPLADRLEERRRRPSSPAIRFAGARASAGFLAAGLLGWLLPNQVLHRLVKRYRQKLQDALPDTVDLIG